jgi:hypothetical protein
VIISVLLVKSWICLDSFKPLSVDNEEVAGAGLGVLGVGSEQEERKANNVKNITFDNFLIDSGID